MTFDEYWNNLRKRNTDLGRDENTMRITVESFRRSMRQAFEMGEQEEKAKSGSINALFGIAGL